MLIVATISPAITFGQTPALQLPTDQSPPGPRFDGVDAGSPTPRTAPRDLSYEPLPPPPIPAAPPGAAISPPPGVVVGTDNFWLASSRRCRQTNPHGCPCGDLDFYHFTAGAPPQLVSRDAFYASLAPGVPLCIVAHGSFTNWQGLCDECWPVFRWIRCPAPHRSLHVLFYTWPSEGPITYEPHIDVALLGMRASFNSIYLADLVARLPPGHPVCFVGHSHGARMAAASLHLLGGGDVDGTQLTFRPSPEQRFRSVMVAAAIDHNWLNPGQRFGLALCRSECSLIMRNDHDIALSLYPLRHPFSQRALGERGLSRRDFRRLGPMAGKVVEMDVTHVIQMGHVWSHYYSHPELGAALVPFVYFESPTDSAMPPALAPPSAAPPTVTSPTAGLPLAPPPAPAAEVTSTANLP